MAKQKAGKAIIKNYYGIILLFLMCLLFSVAVLVQNSIDSRNRNIHIREWGINVRLDNMLEKWSDQLPQSITGSTTLFLDENPVVSMVLDAYGRIEDSNSSAREKYDRWHNSSSIMKVFGSGLLFTSGNAFSSTDGLLLYPGGSVYGPYKPLKKGHYSVSYFGDNMDIAICDVLSYSSQEYNFTEKSRSSDKIVLDLTVFEDVDNVEYRVFNNVPDEVIQLTQVVVEAE